MAGADTPPSPRRRWRWYAAGAAGTVLGLGLLVRGLAASSIGRDFVEARIEGLTPSGQTIAIDGLRGDLLGRFSIEQLTVKDTVGTWLTAEQVRINWSPLGMVSRTLVIDQIAIAELDIARQPVLAPPDEDNPSGGSSNPLRGGDLGAFTVDRLRTGADLTGEAAVFSAAASGAFGRDGARATATLEPEDAGRDRVELSFTWPRGGVPAGQAQITAPAGGMIARLARLQPGQGLTVDADATGEAGDWSLSLLATIDGETAIDAALSDTASGLGGILTADLGAHPLTRDIGTRIGADLVATLTEGTRDGRTELKLDAATDRLTATVATDPNTPEGPIAIEAALTGLGQALGTADLDAERVRLALLTRQTPGDWSIAGDLTAERLETPIGPVARLSGPISANLSGETPALSVALDASGAELEGPLGELLGQAPTVRLNGARDDGASDSSGDTLTIERFHVTGAHAAVSAKGRIGPGGNVLNASGDLRIDGVASGALPLDLAGSWQSVPVPDGLPKIRFEGVATGFQDLPADLAPIIGPRVDLAATASAPPAGGFALEAITVDAAGARLEGALSQSPGGALTATVTGAIDAIDRPGAPLGPIELQLDADGPPGALAVTASIESEALSVAGQSLVNPVVTLDGEVRDFSAFAGAVTARAASSAEPLNLEATVNIDGERWQVAGLDAQAFGLVARGDAAAPFNDPAALRANLAVTGQPSLDSPLQSIDARLLLSDARINLDTNASLAPIGALGTSDVALTVSGTPQAATLTGTANASATLEGRTIPLSLAIDGGLTGLGAAETTLSLVPEIAFGDLRSEPRGPVTVNRRADDGSIEAAGAIGLLGGEAEARFTSTAAGTQLTAAVGDLVLAPVLALLERPIVGGSLSGQLNLETGADPGSTRATLRGAISDLAQASAPENALDITYTADAAANGFSAIVNAQDDDTLDLTASLTGPLAVSDRWPGLSLAQDATLTYAASGAGDIGSLAALALPPSIAATGTIDLTLEGTLPSTPGSTSGRLALANGQVEQGDLGFILTDIDAVASLSGAAVTLEQFSGGDGDGGTLSGEGVYRLGGAAGSTLGLAADGLSVIDRDDIRAKASGQLTLGESPDGYIVEGDLQIDRADIDPSRIGGAGYQTLDVRFNGNGEDEAAPADEAVRLGLDIALRAPRRVFVAGQGLDAEFALEAAITGPAGAPIISGEATIVRGRFEFAGKRFVFQDSRVTLDGDPADAQLDLRAVRDASDITAIIEITGQPSAPKITLSSEPELPEDEVLSRVLFGRSPTELSELEALQLASSVASLSGGGGGFNVIGSLEDALGLDSLDLSSSEGGGTNVTTGKYLSEKVYLQVRTDGIGQPTLVIEWTPLDNVQIETDLTPSEGQGASIQWQREFD